MCGIGGYIQRSRKQTLPYAQDVLKDLVYFSRLRGIDAFGMCRVSRWDATTKADKIEVEKQVGEPVNLAASKAFEDMWKYPADVRYLFFHNRLATKGEKTQVCAQPFVVKKDSAKVNDSGPVIVLAHNGTIHNINGENEFPGVTDSHQLAKMLATDMSLSEFESRIFGAFALVWYDEEDGTLNFFRNEERPMSLVEVPGGIYFGSEGYMVAASIHRRNGGTIQKITNTLPFHHWKYHYDDEKFETVQVQKRKKSFGNQQKSDSGNRLPNYGSNDNWIEQSFPHTALPAPPKSPNSSSIGRDCIQVETFQEPQSRSTGSSRIVLPSGELEKYGTPCSSPPVVDKWARRMSGKRRKRYLTVTEGQGFSKGDTASFSVVSCRQAKRPSQLILEGYVVVFGMQNGEGGLKLERSMEVFGMISAETGGVAGTLIHEKELLLQGKITELQACNENGIMSYRLRLGDIKFTDQKDIYRGRHRASGILNIPTPKVEGLLPIRQGEEREFADSKKSDIQRDAEQWVSRFLDENKPTQNVGVLLSSNPGIKQEKPHLRMFNCDRCSAVHPVMDMSRYKKVFDYEEFDVVVKICNPCNNAVIKESVAGKPNPILEALFKQKFLDETQNAGLKHLENKTGTLN